MVGKNVAGSASAASFRRYLWKHGEGAVGWQRRQRLGRAGDRTIVSGRGPSVVGGGETGILEEDLRVEHAEVIHRSHRHARSHVHAVGDAK